MNAGKAIYYLLANNATVSAITTRIFPEVAPQDADAPFIVYRLTSVSPDDTHDGPAVIDEVRFDVICVSETYDQAADMGSAARAALDRVYGTYSGVNVESIQFDDVNVYVRDQPRQYGQELTFIVRVKRDDVQIATGSPIEDLTLDRLADVDDEITDAIDRQALVYDEATSQWIADGVGALVIPVKNTSGGAFAIGTICKSVSSQGDRITIAAYSAGDDPKLLVGIANENISADADGHVLSYGEIRKVDTSAYSLGDILYPGTSGGFSTSPDAYNIPIAIVTRVHEITGRIFVRSFTPGQTAGASDLNGLSDVTITSAGSGHFLRYDSVNRIWINEPVSIPSPISNTDQLAEGTTNLYFTQARVSANTDVTANTAKNSYPTADAAKLAGIETGAEVNVNADWNSSSGDSQILNKPSIPSTTDDISEGSNLYYTDVRVSANSDVTANTAKRSYPTSDETKLAGIEAGAEVNPTAGEIKTSYESNADTNAFTDAEKTKLSGIATGAEVNVNADWNSSSGDSEILNKPTIYTPRYCQLLRSSAQTLTTTTVAWEDLVYNSETIDTISGGSHTAGTITLTTAGVYVLHFSGEFNNTMAVNVRRVIQVRLVNNGTAIAGTERGTYQRTGRADGDVSIRYIINKTDSTTEVIKVQAQIDQADGSAGNYYYFDNGVFMVETFST